METGFISRVEDENSDSGMKFQFGRDPGTPE